MSIYKYKTASEFVKNLVISLDLLFYLVPIFANDIVRWSILADHNVIPGNHIGDALPNEKINGKRFSKNRCMIVGIRTRIIYDFMVIIQGSYMISWFHTRIKKSSMDSMKSYMILV